MSDEDAVGVELVGELGELSSVAQQGTITMSFATGRIDDAPPVLVPLMTCQLMGTFGREDRDAAPSVTLAYDNVAFLLMQFGTEFLEVLEMLDMVAPGRLGVSGRRLEQAAEWLENGSQATTRAAQKLREIARQIGRDGSEDDAPTANADTAKPVRIRLRRAAASTLGKTGD